jgi:uncharacterized protein (DUF4415 family)
MEKYLTLNNGRKIRLNSPEEEAAINKGIAEDPDAREWTDEDFAKAKPASEVMKPELYATLVARRQRGRPKTETPKIFTAIRLDADVLATFKATGKGWQTRINAILREWVATHA